MLERADQTSHTVQDPHLDLNTAIAALESLIRVVSDIPAKYEDFRAQAAKTVGHSNYTVIRNRIRQASVRLFEPGAAPPAAECIDNEGDAFAHFKRTALDPVVTA